MKQKLHHILAPALAVVLLAGSATAVAQQGPKPEQQIKWRQSAFQVVAWNAGRIKASLDGQYNKDEVQRAANTIAAIANGGLGSLFPATTETGKGWHDTATTPAAFKDTAKFGAAGQAFAKEATALAQLAPGGDVAALKTQFAALQKTCKGCHDDFKSKD
ncbi:MAG: c-type cytochrome [Gammaproteobacteria bacterium]